MVIRDIRRFKDVGDMAKYVANSLIGKKISDLQEKYDIPNFDGATMRMGRIIDRIVHKIVDPDGRQNSRGADFGDTEIKALNARKEIADYPSICDIHNFYRVKDAPFQQTNYFTKSKDIIIIIHCDGVIVDVLFINFDRYEEYLRDAREHWRLLQIQWYAVTHNINYPIEHPIFYGKRYSDDPHKVRIALSIHGVIKYFISIAYCDYMKRDDATFDILRGFYITDANVVNGIFTPLYDITDPGAFRK